MKEPSLTGDRRLDAILAEYSRRKDTGQSLNEEALLRAYPDLADGLRSWFRRESLTSVEAPKVHAEKAASESGTNSQAFSVRETQTPGSYQRETSSPLRSRSFGRYMIIRQLGEGAMGNVYLAHDTSLDRQIALKIPKTPAGESDVSLARFTFEAKAAAGLKHPNICSVYDADQCDGIPYITMDYIDGFPLSRFIGSKHLQSVDSVLRMISAIAEAVEHAHSKGVIHRDLKPANILVDANLRPHITDFGLARRIGKTGDPGVTTEGLLLGTPAYMAPEQINGEHAKVGPQSDVYSLGVLLFELLTCRLPFEGSVPEMLAQVLRDNPPEPGEFRKGLPEDIDDICLKMLRKDPQRRYPSMAEVISAIQTFRKKTDKDSVSSPVARISQSPFDKRKTQIEEMLKRGQYAAAIQSLEKLARERTPGAKDVVDWAKKRLPQVRAEERALNPEGIDAFLKTAMQLYDKSDYAGCVHLLSEVPPLRRNEKMEELLRIAARKELESEELLSEIKDAERIQVMDGIEPLVRRLLKLKPGNEYAKRLLETLQNYSRIPASRRRYRFKNGRLRAVGAQRSLSWQWLFVSILVLAIAFLPIYFSARSFFFPQIPLTLDIDNAWLRTQGGEVTLLLDGTSHSITRQSLQEGFGLTVPPGSHTVSVRKGDRRVHEARTIEVGSDAEYLLRINSKELSLLVSLPNEVIDPFFAPAAASIPAQPHVLAPAEAQKPVKFGLPEEIGNKIGMRLRLIPAGEFSMGSPPTEKHRVEGEGPARNVRITRPFYVSITEVTQTQWNVVMKTSPWQHSTFVRQGGNYPATHVSWHDAVEYCRILSALDGQHYRLPTEAEWEYSCSGRVETAYSFGAEAVGLKTCAWYAENANNIGENFAHSVGTKEANPFGLCDMHGNVWEWCSDWHGKYDPSSLVDPQGPSSGFDRVYRGGGWDSTAARCRSATREGDVPSFQNDYLGFRVVLVPSLN